MINPIAKIVRAIDRPARPFVPIKTVKTASASSNFAEVLANAIKAIK